MALLVLLPMFRETNAVGVVFEREDEEKLFYLTSIMTSTRISGKLYATWFRFFYKGGHSRNRYIVEEFLAHWLSWFVLPSSPEYGLNPHVFPLDILLTKGEKLMLALLKQSSSMHDLSNVWETWSGFCAGTVF